MTRAFSHRRLARIALPLMLLCACAASAAFAAASTPASSAAAGSRRDVNDSLPQRVDRLIATPFNDPDALGRLMDAPLGAAQARDGFLVHTSAAGRLGDVPLRNIELRRSVDGVGDMVLMMAIADGAIPFDPAAWPGAVPRARDPDAPASRASWSFERGGTTVVLGLDARQTHLVRILIRKP